MENDSQRAAGVAICNLMGALLPQLMALGMPPASVTSVLKMFDQLNEGMITPGPLLDALKAGTQLHRDVYEQAAQM